MIPASSYICRACHLCVLTSLRAIIFALESHEKRSILLSKFRNLNGEVTSSTLSRVLFSWLMPLMRLGYRRNLGLDDLDTPETKMGSEKLRRRLEERWNMGQYERSVARAETMMRGSLSAPVYDKATRLDLASPSVSGAGSLTLVATDTAQAAAGARQLHELWVGALEICAAWIAASQDRVSATSRTLGGVKWLRASGLNDVAFGMLARLRAVELGVPMRFRVLVGLSLVILIATLIISPILAFGIFAGLATRGDGGTLDVVTAFTSKSLLVPISAPLSGIIVAVPVLADSVTSFGRIQDFLTGEETEDSCLNACIASDALARALYAKKEFVVLDDVFGGLGAATADLKDGRDTGVANDEKPGAQQQAIPTAIAGPLDSPDQTDSTHHLGDSTMYLFYGEGAGWYTVAAFLVAMIVFAFCNSFPYIWLGWWAEANAQHLGKWLGVYTALGVGAIIAVLIGAWSLLPRCSTKEGVESSNDVPFERRQWGDSQQVQPHLQLIDMELPAAALAVAVSTFFAIREVVLVAVSSRYRAAALPVIALAFWAVQHFYLRTSLQMRLLDIEHRAPLHTTLLETLDGLESIRTLGWQGRAARRNAPLVDASQRPAYLLLRLRCWLTHLVDVLVAGFAVVLVVVATALRDQIGPARTGLVTGWVMLEVALGAVARVKNFAAPRGGGDCEADEELRRLDESRRLGPVGSWPSRGAAEFLGVTASYTFSGPVLENATFSLTPGQRVAVCGRTGSGKSSLALAMLHTVDEVSGAIAIDGVDISTLPGEYVRSGIVAVSQEAYIFDATVRVNVDPTTVEAGDGSSGQKDSNADSSGGGGIVKALEAVELWEKIQRGAGLTP
ncbi:hypothetical protein RB597_005302 [Gaeumannomyces tritici]